MENYRTEKSTTAPDYGTRNAQPNVGEFDDTRFIGGFRTSAIKTPEELELLMQNARKGKPSMDSLD